MFKYPVGFPLWRVFARAGVPLSVSVEVLYDNEANVFVATSQNLRGLVVESEDFKTLSHEINTSVSELLELELNQPVDMHTVV